MIIVGLASHIMQVNTTNPLFSVCSFIGCVPLEYDVQPGHQVSQMLSCTVSSKCLCNIQRVPPSDKVTCFPGLLTLDSSKSVETQRQWELKSEFNSGTNRIHHSYQLLFSLLTDYLKKKGNLQEEGFILPHSLTGYHLSCRERHEGVHNHGSTKVALLTSQQTWKQTIEYAGALFILYSTQAHGMGPPIFSGTQL